MRPGAVVVLTALLGAGASHVGARTLALAGTFGNQALLVIDGAAPRAVAVGHTLQGIEVLGVDDTGATIRDNGRQLRLSLGAVPLNLGAAPAARSSPNPGMTVLQAQPNGQFVAQAVIDGHPLTMMVDTGATLVTLSRDQARQLGLDLSRGTPVQVHTANGPVSALRVTLNSVRVGQIEQSNVDAVVQDKGLPIALLGMSFLRRLDLRREGDQLMLRRESGAASPGP